MADERGSIGRFFAGWEDYNEAIVKVVREMTDAQLALRPAPNRWPMWATIAHTAGGRLYWLCGVFGEPGAEETPFPEAVSGYGWEDDEEHPRSAAELAAALESTWRIVARCLATWTPAMLEETVVRATSRGHEVHSRQSVLIRLLSHDAYHAGELSQTLGIHHLTQIDLWPPQAQPQPPDA